VADTSIAELLLPLTLFLTADSCAVGNSTAVSTTGTLCARLKMTYGYYYYLCFKDFFKKLLKPKKMIIVKWKIDPNSDFKFYTEITNDLFYYCSPIFYQGEYNQNNKIYEFEISNFDKQIRQDVIQFKPQEFFRIITNNNQIDYIITKDLKYNTIIKDCEVLKWFENEKEIQFNRNVIIDRNVKCVLDYVENLFVVIEGNFEITNDISNLKKIEYKQFVDMFRIK